jgi:hypothetical protein
VIQKEDCFAFLISNIQVNELALSCSVCYLIFKVTYQLLLSRFCEEGNIDGAR